MPHSRSFCPRPLAVLVSCLPLLLLGAGTGSASEEAKSLLRMEEWRKPGAWGMADSISGDPEEKRWKQVEPGTRILYNGAEGKTTDLVSQMEHGDIEVHAEFMIPKSSNSGLYFQNRYEIQILDSYGRPDDQLKNHDCGGVYERWNDDAPGKDKGFEGTPPRTNASKAPGEWQSFHIIFRAPRFDESGKKTENARFVRVVHNGVTIHENVEVTGPTRGGSKEEKAKGPIRIQGDHGPVAFRRLEVKALD